MSLGDEDNGLLHTGLPVQDHWFQLGMRPVPGPLISYRLQLGSLTAVVTWDPFKIQMLRILSR